MTDAVTLEDVRHRYPSREDIALDIEGLRIARGERVAIVGHSRAAGGYDG